MTPIGAGVGLEVGERVGRAGEDERLQRDGRRRVGAGRAVRTRRRCEDGERKPAALGAASPPPSPGSSQMLWSSLPRCQSPTPRPSDSASATRAAIDCWSVYQTLWWTPLPST